MSQESHPGDDGSEADPAIDTSRAPERAAPRGDLKEPEHADYLAAIWIMAANDEGHIITYRGIAFRLGITEQYARQLVASRPELFRRRVPTRHLKEWTTRIGATARGPSWLFALPLEERSAAIAGLTPDDCFRTQFRAERGAPRSDLETIEWGLKHLDRVRSTIVKYDEGVAKSWQMWLTIALTFINIVIHLAFMAAKGH